MSAALLVLLFAPIFGFRAEGPFSDLTFDQAVAKAQREQKIVFVDFFTTWCGPCKQLDASTWKNEAVQKWFAEKTVALKIDAEKETELAKRYRIEGYPTLLLLKTDGTEIDRMVGFRDATKFLSEVADALAGKDAVARAKENVLGKENDAMARKAYGQELARKGRHEEALAEYLWCFDHGKESLGFGGVRRSFLLSDIAQLGRSYSAATEALVERRDAAEKRLAAGAVSFDDMMDFAAINRTLKTGERTLALYDRLEKPLPNSFRIVFLRELRQPLRDARRYQDLLDLTDGAVASVAHAIEMYEYSVKLSRGEDEAKLKMLEEANQYRKRSLVREESLLYEALLGTSKTEEASKVAERLIAFEPTGATYAALVEAARRVEAGEVVRSLVDRAKTTLPEKDRAAVDEAATK